MLNHDEYKALRAELNRHWWNGTFAYLAYGIALAVAVIIWAGRMLL